MGQTTSSDGQALEAPVSPQPEGEVDEEAFDFEAHRQQAVDAYQPLVPLYTDFSRTVYSILRTCLDKEEIKVNSVEYRAKDPESFGRKAEQADEDNPNRPKYSAPLEDITDLGGARVITFFPSTEGAVDKLIEAEFDVVEKIDKSELLEQEERLGYHSVHYLVSLKSNRFSLPEYEQFNGLIAEVQVRTILQHAWAEIEHDIQYKAVSTLPAAIRRRFMTLAGLLEIADREFQALENEDKRLREEARASVAAGRLQEVEITPDALNSYLDQELGPDGRMTAFSYRFATRVLKRLGFTDLLQLSNAIAPYDDDAVSRAGHFGMRQGQLSRLDDVLMCAMGEEFIERHPFARDAYLRRLMHLRLERIRKAGIEVGEYRPEDDQAAAPGDVEPGTVRD